MGDIIISFAFYVLTHYDYLGFIARIFSYGVQHAVLRLKVIPTDLSNEDVKTVVSPRAIPNSYPARVQLVPLTYLGAG